MTNRPRDVGELRKLAQVFAAPRAEPSDTWGSERKLARELLAALRVVEAAGEWNDAEGDMDEVAATDALIEALRRWRDGEQE